MNYDDALKLSYDFIIQNEIATEDEVNLVIDINGYNFSSLNNIIHVRTTYHDIKQIYDCEKDTYYFNDEIKQNIDNEYFNRG